MLGTLLLHALPFIIYIEDSNALPTDKEIQEPEFAYIDLNNPQGELEHEIAHWVNVGDPTLLTVPNEYFGFSIIRNGKRQLPVKNISEYSFTIETTDEMPFIDINLGETFANLPNEISYAWQLNLTAIPEKMLPPSKSVYPNSFIWRLLDGRVINLPLPKDEMVKQELEKTMLTANATRFLIYRISKDRVRVRVEKSCGNKELDLMAIKVLKGQIANILHGVAIDKRSSLVIPPIYQYNHLEMVWSYSKIYRNLVKKEEK